MSINNYREYIVNKSSSVILSALILILISLNSNLQVQWRWLVVGMIVLGHGHFITSYVYQVRSWKYKLPISRNVIVFLFSVAALAGILMYVRFGLGYNQWTLVFIGAYFLVHNTLNERTMFVDYSKKEKNSYLITFVIMAFLIWIYFGTINHVSFSFFLSESVVNLDTIGNEIEIDDYYNIIPSFMLLIPLIIGIVLTMIFIFKEYSKNKKSALSLSLVVILLLAVGLSGIITNFIYLLGFVVIYHYFTWFFYYIKKTGSGQDFLRKRGVYMVINAVTYIVVIGIFLLGNFFNKGVISEIYFIVFSINYFVLWIFLHITSTLINEKAINRIFRF